MNKGQLTAIKRKYGNEKFGKISEIINNIITEKT